MAKNSAKYSERRWMKPPERAKGYVQERKKKIHMFGKKEGEQLTDYEKGFRSGYLLCQSDHAGIYKYSKARKEGKSAKEAARISKIKGKGA